MIERIIKACFAKPLLAVVLVMIGAWLGLMSFLDLRRDVFPDLSAPVFNVIVQNAAMGAEELETAVAVPIEVALAGLPDVRRIRSNSQLGVCQVTVEFEADADYYRSRQLVAERVVQATSQLPPGTDAPLISSLTGRLNEIFELTLESSDKAPDLMALRDLAEFDVKNRLLAVPGVAAVECLGGFLRQFQVQIDPERMAARRVTIEEVLHAVEGANENAAGGLVTQGPMEWTVRAVGRAGTLDDLAGTVVAMRGASPILVGDVADVREAPAVRRGMAHAASGEVVSARVVKQFGADTVKVAAGIRQAIEEIRKSLPKGVSLRIIYDQSELVRSALGGVGRAVLIGAIFVVLVQFVLLGNLRAAIIVTLTIPLSIALAGLLLKRAQVGLNTMTLGGLAIAVGLLVDAAIIMTENIVQHMTASQRSASRREHTAASAAHEVGRPIAFATLIVIAVFLPLFGMSGVEGLMYQPLAAAVIASVGAALVLALTLVPVVAGHVLRPRAEGKHEDVWLMRKLKRVYAPLLDACMKHAGWVYLVSLGLTVPAIGLGFLVGSDFMPKLDEGAFLVQTILPPEAALAEVDLLNHRVEETLRAIPEVADVVRRTGRAERTEDPMPHTLSDVLVVLKESRQRSLDAIEDDMRERLVKVPGVASLFTTPLGMRIDEGLGGSPADISVRIFGPELDVLASRARRAQEIMASVPGIEDLRSETLTGLPQLRITVDRAAAARAGRTPGDVIQDVRVALVGEEMPQMWRGQRRYDLVVKLKNDAIGDVRALRGLLVDGFGAMPTPLGRLATIEEVFGAGSIRREAGSRRIAVEASVSGRDLGGAAAEVRAKLLKELKLPTGYFFDVGGRVESQERATRALRTAIVVALLAVFVLLYLALGSIADTLVILATIPSAFVGGIVALLLAHETWNVSSLVGLIGLFGIAVQNSLVLVAQTRILVAEGRPFALALREASIGRVRPKVMTAATAILGLLPILALRLHGTEIERPLAIVMTGGLVTSTLFTLLALPTFYTFVHRTRERVSSGRSGKRSPAAQQEEAVR